MNRNAFLIAGGHTEFLIIVEVLMLWLCSKSTFSLLALLMKLMWDSSAGAGMDEGQLCSELAIRAEHQKLSLLSGLASQSLQ